MSDVSWAAIAPLAILVLAFVIFCWVDISRNEVKHLPKWAWAIVALVSLPIGGIIYLAIGRQPR